MTIPSIELNNGTLIPQVGLGVYQISGDDNTRQAVSAALKMGYRHIDTAHAYQNERGVGQAVATSGIERKDIWITSKLWPHEYGKDLTQIAIDKMLDRLNTPYLDLLLLHQQVGDYMGAWQAMEAAVRSGKVRAIGLSNFDGARLDEVLRQATIKPAIMQVELHPYFQQNDLKEILAPYGTKLESWYPLGHGDPQLLNETLFSELAKKYHKSNAQIILRWHTQVGHIVFPKTTNPAHMSDNIALFDFELTDLEMAKIAALDCNKRYFNVPLEQQAAQFMAWHPED
ncbi:aldo/keto reductase [Lapidilactobacillus achengensis]|uniref:Aldo/keto reductase n=1 Tax=Lapidilactobacillus achengensis TaxID=2486000 RepID=A0ABW1UMZ7_9LACO|nr:aldo/keto reductase [Lapidilactobacillus achengensis]